MKTTIKQLKNHIKINDWVSILNDFDALVKQLAGASKITKVEGIPKFYFAAVLKIHDALAAATSGDKAKKMNAGNARAMNAMKQKLRKHDKQYEKQYEAYKKDPYVSEEEAPKKKKKARPASVKKESESEEESEEESSEEESDESDKPKAKPKAKTQKNESDSDEETDDDDDNDDDDDDDSEEWDSDSDTGSDSDVDLGSKDIYTRAYWVKKVEVKTEKKVRQQKPAGNKAEKKLKSVEEAAAAPVGQKKATIDAGKVYTPDLIMKKLKELVAMRGKRGTDRNAVIDNLKILASKATTPIVMLKVKTALAAAMFDSVLNTVKYMPAKLWQECLGCLVDMITTLKENPNVRLSEEADVTEAFDEVDESEGFLSLESLMMDDEARAKKEAEKRKRDEEERAKLEASGSNIQYVTGNLYSFVQRLSAEFKKSLQNIDPHTPDYVIRLRDEPSLVSLVSETREYYKSVENAVFERLSVLMYLELVYYHYSPEFDVLKAGAQANSDSLDTVRRLAGFLYTNGDSMEKMRALLCHVYHLSLHNRYHEARNLLLMSHVQDSINDADIRTRILFNRTTAQLGLCAFRVGETRQALDCLADLILSSKTKELLAQGITTNKFNDRDLEKEKLERRLQYPYHMHMNLDVLESVHLLSAMIAEVPNTALYGTANKRKRDEKITKHFRRLLDHHQSKAFNGPPENTRDCIMAATTSLQDGDWKKALENITRLKMWSLTSNSEVVMKTIINKIQEVALRTYLLTFGPQYVSLALDDLVSMFELEEKRVYRICCKMMVNEQLHGTWDQPSRCIIMSSVQPSPIQKAAMEYVDKAALFVEQNERLLDQRGYNYFNHQNFGGKGRQDWNYNNNYNNYNNYNYNSYNSYNNSSHNRNQWGNQRREYYRRAEAGQAFFSQSFCLVCLCLWSYACLFSASPVFCFPWTLSSSAPFFFHSLCFPVTPFPCKFLGSSLRLMERHAKS